MAGPSMVVFGCTAPGVRGHPLEAAAEALSGANAGLPDTYGMPAEELAAMLNSYREAKGARKVTRGRRQRRPLVIAGSIVLAVIVATTVTTKVLERRAERDARVVLDRTGVPAGFEHVGTTARGSVYCFGPCRRVYASYLADMPFPQAIARITEHLRAKSATKRCDLMLSCEAPLVPEDCRPFNEGPVCRMALMVDGRALLVSVSRTGHPTEMELMGKPKKDINLFF